MDHSIAGLKGVVFDLDGTLSDTWPPALDAFRAAIEGFADRTFSDEELKSFAGPSEDGIMKNVVPDNWEACMDAYISGFKGRLIPGKIVFPGVLEALELLRAKNKRLAIVSGKTKRAVDIACDLGGISSFFDPVIGGHVSGERKADDILQILELWGFEASSIAYVGDTQGDIGAGRAAGAVTIGAAWADYTNSCALAQANPDELFETTEAFCDWVRAQSG